MKRLRQKEVKQLQSFFAEANRSKTLNEIDIQRFFCDCGTKMEPATSFSLFGNGSKQKKEYLLCPACSSYCRIKKSNSGKYYLVSTPADKELRSLRQEAHFYFEKIVEENLIGNKNAVYAWLTLKLGFPVAETGSALKHIGELNKGNCQRAIAVCIDFLAEHKEQLSSPLTPYVTKSGKSYTEKSPLLMNKIKE